MADASSSSSWGYGHQTEDDFAQFAAENAFGNFPEVPRRTESVFSKDVNCDSESVTSSIATTIMNTNRDDQDLGEDVHGFGAFGEAAATPAASHEHFDDAFGSFRSLRNDDSVDPVEIREPGGTEEASEAPTDETVVPPSKDAVSSDGDFVESDSRSVDASPKKTDVLESPCFFGALEDAQSTAATVAADSEAPLSELNAFGEAEAIQKNTSPGDLTPRAPSSFSLDAFADNSESVQATGAETTTQPSISSLDAFGEADDTSRGDFGHASPEEFGAFGEIENAAGDGGAASRESTESPRAADFDSFEAFDNSTAALAPEPTFADLGGRQDAENAVDEHGEAAAPPAAAAAAADFDAFGDFDGADPAPKETTEPRTAPARQSGQPDTAGKEVPSADICAFGEVDDPTACPDEATDDSASVSLGAFRAADNAGASAEDAPGFPNADFGEPDHASGFAPQAIEPPKSATDETSKHPAADFDMRDEQDGARTAVEEAIEPRASDSKSGIARDPGTVASETATAELSAIGDVEDTAAAVRDATGPVVEELSSLGESEKREEVIADDAPVPLTLGFGIGHDPNAAATAAVESLKADVGAIREADDATAVVDEASKASTEASEPPAADFGAFGDVSGADRAVDEAIEPSAAGIDTFGELDISDPAAKETSGEEFDAFGQTDDATAVETTDPFEAEFGAFEDTEAVGSTDNGANEAPAAGIDAFGELDDTGSAANEVAPTMFGEFGENDDAAPAIVEATNTADVEFGAFDTEFAGLSTNEASEPPAAEFGTFGEAEAAADDDEMTKPPTGEFGAFGDVDGPEKDASEATQSSGAVIGAFGEAEKSGTTVEDDFGAFGEADDGTGTAAEADDSRSRPFEDVQSTVATIAGGSEAPLSELNAFQESEAGDQPGTGELDTFGAADDESADFGDFEEVQGSGETSADFGAFEEVETGDEFGTFEEVPSAVEPPQEEFGEFGDFADAPETPAEDANDDDFGNFDDAPAADFGDFETSASAGFGTFAEPASENSTTNGTLVTLLGEDIGLYESANAIVLEAFGIANDTTLADEVGELYEERIQQLLNKAPTLSTSLSLPSELSSALLAALALSPAEEAEADRQRPPPRVVAHNEEEDDAALRSPSPTDGFSPPFDGAESTPTAIDDLSAFLSDAKASTPTLDDDFAATPTQTATTTTAAASAPDDMNWDFFDAMSSSAPTAEPGAQATSSPPPTLDSVGSQVDAANGHKNLQDEILASLGVNNPSTSGGGLGESAVTGVDAAPAPAAAASSASSGAKLNRLVDRLPDLSFLLSKALVLPLQVSGDAEGANNARTSATNRNTNDDDESSLWSAM